MSLSISFPQLSLPPPREAFFKLERPLGTPLDS